MLACVYYVGYPHVGCADTRMPVSSNVLIAGVMFNKDVVAPGRMRRKIHNPRILLLDCPLEYKKGENQTNVEILKEEDW